MIKVQFIPPPLMEYQQFQKTVVQPIFKGDIVLSRSGAIFIVKSISHSSNTFKIPGTDTWSEEPIIIAELMEK